MVILLSYCRWGERATVLLCQRLGTPSAAATAKAAAAMAIAATSDAAAAPGAAAPPAHRVLCVPAQQPAWDEQLHTLRPLWRQATPAGHITGALCLLHHWLATPASAAAAVIRSDIVQSYHRCTLTNTQSWCRATLLIAVGHCRSNLHVQLIHPPCIHASMQPISPMHPAPMQHFPRHASIVRCASTNVQAVFSEVACWVIACLHHCVMSVPGVPVCHS